MPDDDISSVASSTEVNGRRSIDTHIAPIPIATAGTSCIPGRFMVRTPSAAPMNMLGNTGPPRNALSDRP